MPETDVEPVAYLRRSRLRRVLGTSVALIWLSILLFGVSPDNLELVGLKIPCLVALVGGCLLMLCRFKPGLEAMAELGLVLFLSACTVIALGLLAFGTCVAIFSDL